MGKKAVVVLMVLLVLCMSLGCGTNVEEKAEQGDADGNQDSVEQAEKPQEAAESDGEVVVLKLGHVNSESTALHQAMLSFAENVNERSGGKVCVDVYANAQLGNERDMVEGMQLGTVDFVYCAIAVAANFTPDFLIFNAPFLFEDSEHFFKVADSEIGTEICEKFRETQGVRVLGVMDAGQRHIYSKKPLETIEDLKGLKIRTMENDVHISMFNMLGAQATPMAFGELYTALQQNTVDAAEGAYQGITANGHHELCQYVTDSGHVYDATLFCVSEKTFQNIPNEFKDMVLEEGWNATLYQRELVAEANLNAIDELKEQGCEIIHFDQQPLKDAVAGIFEEFADVIPPELVTKVREFK